MSEDDRPEIFTPDYMTPAGHDGGDANGAHDGNGDGGLDRFDGGNGASGDAIHSPRRLFGRARRRAAAIGPADPAIAPPTSEEPVRGGDGASLHPPAPEAWTAARSAYQEGAAAPPPPLDPIDPIDMPWPAQEEPPPEPAAPRTRLKKLRLTLIIVAILLLGLVSFVFGMFMAVASDLPTIENYPKFNNARNSVLLDDQGRMLGVLSDHNRILVTPRQIPPIVKEAVISIEDKRFYHNSGIDVRGIARAFFQDLLHKRAVQGASTIEQQFVKNALQAQAHRTVFEKLREAALAYHLTRKWSKDKIISEYLNTIYFGNGAYGIESAARTYFGEDVNHLGCGTLQRLCVSELKPWEAAMLGGLIASPSAYDPGAHPLAAKARRDVVLKNMWQQGYISRAMYQESLLQPLPARKDISPPHETSVTPAAGYFTSWVRQQLIDRYGAQRALEGGLRVRTTLDLDLQRAAEQAVNNYLAYTGGPTASLVAIDNQTGEVRAMVGGRDYNQSPFNLATSGERQPGSSFKAFVLAQALREGVSPNSEWTSAVKTFVVPNSGGKEHFVVHNDNNAYSGTTSLTDATAYSDNSVFAEMGIKAGTAKIAHLAERMGIRTPVSTNPAMTIGGLKTGVTALDMAHAYETLAHGGQRVDSPFSPDGGPTGIEDVQSPAPLFGGRHEEHNHPILTRVLPAGLVSTETQLLEGVIQYGTAKSAQIGQFAAGKTGTTSNFGDAWFVGWNSHYTVAVWVGYPNGLKPMKYDFNGQPVMGGTYPALIWHDFMISAIGIDSTRNAARQAARAASGATGATGATTTDTSTTPTTAGGSSSGTTSTSSGSSSGSSTSSGHSTPHGSAPPSSTGSGGGTSGTGVTTGGGGSGSAGAGTGTGSSGTGTSGTGTGSGSSGTGTSSGGGGSGSGTSGSGSGGSAAPSGGTGAPPG